MKSFHLRAVFFALGVVVASGSAAFSDTLTYHDDTYRTGWNPHETILTTSNVRSLVREFTAHVDGLIFTQPLVALNVKMPRGPARNLAIVGTNNDTLYAFDAAKGTTVWKTSFAVNGATAVPVSFDGCDNVGQEDGILSTPVIDRSTNTIYVVAATLEGPQTGKHIHYRLHALSLSTGNEKTANANIGGSFAGPNGQIVFDADVQFQRPGLLESSGNIYIAFGGQCDFNATRYHGWVFAYSATTLARDAIINITPSKDNNGNYFGGIWMSGGAVAGDASGNVYFVVGNGTFDGGVANFGESVLRLPPDLSLAHSSFFTPYTVFGDNNADADFGSGGVMLLPDQRGTRYPHLAVAQGKEGIFTLMDRDNLGGYVAGGPDRVLDEISLGAVWSSPGSFRDAAGHVFVLTAGGPLYSVLVSGASASVVGETTIDFPSDNGNGSTPTISSNGTKSGTQIAWIVRNPANVQTDHLELYAFDASNIKKQLFSANLGMWPQSNLNPTLFPTIADGRAYVPTANSLVAFGLRSSDDAFANQSSNARDVATAALSARPHLIHGIVTRIGQYTLQVRVRNGNKIDVDIARARTAGRTGVLYVNRPVALFGDYDAAHVYRVDEIENANGLRNGSPWPADR